jgi:hypothetical protein
MTIRSGCPNRARIPSAAKYPLRTAPSIVAGQPVRVQSPASSKFEIAVCCRGLIASSPGRTEKTACGSVITFDRKG